MALNWRKVQSIDGLLIYWESPCASYRVQPLYSNRWHACLRLEPDGTWLEFSGKESLAEAMRKCRADLDQQHANNPAA